MKAWDYIEAARVPKTLRPQTFGLWTIERVKVGPRMEFVHPTELSMTRAMVGFDDYTLLRHFVAKSMYLETPGEIVMEDSARELKKHLPIWVRARGRVLVTGLGLGCVVRGLLANPDVDRVEVVEIDRGIARVVGAEFAGNPKVGLTLGDALEIDLPGRFDFAWHDLWTETGSFALHKMHNELLVKYRDRCGPQGAWAFPRFLSRLYRQTFGYALLGAPR